MRIDVGVFLLLIPLGWEMLCKKIRERNDSRMLRPERLVARERSK